MVAKGPPGLQRNPPGSGHFGRTSPVARISRLKAPAISGKLAMPLESFPVRRDCRPAASAGFAISGPGFAVLAMVRAGLLAPGERGAIFPALQPARLRS